MSENFMKLKAAFPSVDWNTSEETRMFGNYNPLEIALGALQKAEAEGVKAAERLRVDLRPDSVYEAVMPHIRNLENVIEEQQENIEASKALFSQETKKAAFPKIQPKSELRMLMDQLNQSEIRKYLKSFKGSEEKLNLTEDRLKAGDDSFLIAAEKDPTRNTFSAEILENMRYDYEILIIKRMAPTELERQQGFAQDAKNFDLIAWALKKMMQDRRKELGTGPESLINQPFEKKKEYLEAHGQQKTFTELNI